MVPQVDTGREAAGAGLKYLSRIGALALAAGIAAAPIHLQASPQVPAAEDAPIALLVDATTGQVLHTRDADRRFLPASVTKVMTAYVAFEMLSDGRLSPDTNFTVSDEVYEKWSGTGSSMFLQRGEKVSVDKLLRGITTVSANDGCVALAEGAAGSLDNWIVLMNRAARDLGMNDSHFGSPNGFPDEGQTFTSAQDLAKLAHALTTRHAALYERYFGKHRFAHNGYEQVNHDPITGVVPGADGIKTGFTREAGYNFLGSAKRDGRRLAMVVAGVDNGARRARISRDYLEWGFSAFEARELFAPEEIVAHAAVQDGAERSVALRSAFPIFASIKEGTDPAIALTLHYRGPIKAPIAAGSEVAELEVRIDGFTPYRVPLQAAADVPEANFWQRMVNGVASFLS